MEYRTCLENSVINIIFITLFENRNKTEVGKNGVAFSFATSSCIRTSVRVCPLPGTHVCLVYKRFSLRPVQRSKMAIHRILQRERTAEVPWYMLCDMTCCCWLGVNFFLLYYFVVITLTSCYKILLLLLIECKITALIKYFPKIDEDGDLSLWGIYEQHTSLYSVFHGAGFNGQDINWFLD